MPTNNSDVKFQYMSEATFGSATKNDNTFYVVQLPNGNRDMYLGNIRLNVTIPYKKVLATSGTLVFSGTGTQYIDIASQYWNFTNLKLVVRIIGGVAPEDVYQTYEDIRIMYMSYVSPDSGTGPVSVSMTTQSGNERIQVNAMNAVFEIQYWVYAENYEV